MTFLIGVAATLTGCSIFFAGLMLYQNWEEKKERRK